MIHGRYLSGALSRNCGSVFRTINPQERLSNNVRAMTSFKAPAIFKQKKHNAKPDVNLVARRFFHERKHGFNKDGPSSTWYSNLLSAIGALLGVGVGAGAAYLSKEDGNGILSGFATAHCARGGCGCDDDKCVEKKCDQPQCLRQGDCEEEKIIKANQDLEKVLKEVKCKATEHTEVAMKAYCEAIKIMQEYLNQGYCIIDNDELESPMYEESWCCLYELAKKRCEKVKDALQKGMCAWELLCRLRDVIKSGRCCKFTSCNPLLKTAEEFLRCAEKELMELKQKMDCVSSDHDLVEMYSDVIQVFRQDMKSDVENLPESEQCCIKFCEQETAMIINQAYRKILRVQKEMAQALLCQGRVPEKQSQTLC